MYDRNMLGGPMNVLSYKLGLAQDGRCFRKEQMLSGHIGA